MSIRNGWCVCRGCQCNYDPLEVPPLALSRTELRLRVDATVYWCGQSLYKYLPRHDEIFPRIAAAAGDTQFVFIEHGSRFVTALFRMRLEQAFAALGLRATDHCVLLPRMDIQRFLAVMGVCDVFLDSLGWSGFNTAMESSGARIADRDVARGNDADEAQQWCVTPDWGDGNDRDVGGGVRRDRDTIGARTGMALGGG